MGESKIDPEIKEMFGKIMVSIFAWITWMMINTILGIVMDLGFQDNPAIPQWEHICFYVWFAASIAGMIWLMIKIWKPPTPPAGGE